MKNIKNKTCRKSNKKSKRIHKKSRRTRGGSCPCSKPFLFSKMSGGSGGENPSFNHVPIRSFYPQNNYNNDVQGEQMSSRLGVQTPITPNLMKGGKKRRRKMKGGVFGGPFSEQMIRTTTGPLALPGIVGNYDGLSGSLMTRNIVGSRLI